MKHLRVGIDASRTAVAARTGTEHYTYELLAAIARNDHATRYTLYCNQPPAALPPLSANFSLRRIPFPRLWTHARLSAELIRNPPDVLFVPAHVIPLGAPLRRDLRTVVTIHDLGYVHFPDAHTRAQRLYLRLSTAWSARVADEVIAISKTTRDDLVRYVRVPAQKIHVIHHGVSQRFHPIEDPRLIDGARARYGIDAPYFLFIGTVQPRKNLERLIEAFAVAQAGGLALETGAGAHPLLVIAGKRGWLTDAIERRAAALGIAERVRFIGYVPDDDVPPLLGGTLGFVFPSLYEGFGMPVLEAMACGAPVLTSATSSLPEIADDAALLVDPNDTQAIARGLRALASDPRKRADLAARGIARAAGFTWDTCARSTLHVLHS